MIMMKPPNKGHLRITDEITCTNLSVIKRFHCSLFCLNYQFTGYFIPAIFTLISKMFYEIILVCMSTHTKQPRSFLYSCVTL